MTELSLNDVYYNYVDNNIWSHHVDNIESKILLFIDTDVNYIIDDRLWVPVCINVQHTVADVLFQEIYEKMYAYNVETSIKTNVLNVLKGSL